MALADMSPVKVLIFVSLLIFCPLFQWGMEVYCQPMVIAVDDFEAGLQPRWTRKDFERETKYSVVSMGEGHCLKAESHSSASGLIYKIKYRLQDYPLLSWRWKVDNVLDKGDARKKAGDDYAARVYVIFPHWIPAMTRSINYIWANKLPKGNHLPNPYYAKAIMLALESGEEHVGEWKSVRRNVREDYRRLFGEEPRRVGAIAIMTDTDNTMESATAYYDDIMIGKTPVVLPR
jgi:hypothetical protein